MPTLQQLPQATNPAPTDQVLLQQPGKTAVATVANLLATTQPKLMLATGALLGRASALPGAPEPVGVGAGLVMQAGTLAADTAIVARLASPAFSGTPTAPTPGLGDNSTAIATTAFVQSHTGPISVVGDISGAGSGTVALTLPAITSPGTFAKVTVNAKGQVTAGGSLAAGDVMGALGFAPYPASNPAGYVTSSAVPVAGSGLVANAGTLSVALAGLDGSTLTVTPAGGTARTLAAMAADTANYARAASLAPVATSGSYGDLANKPTLAPVAGTGNYSDLQNKPTLAPVAASGRYTDLSGTPTLATVATSGNYTDLAGKPTLAPVAGSGRYADLTGAPTLAAVATSGNYTDLVGKPTLAPVAASGRYADLSGAPTLATVATSGSYTDLASRPTFASVATSGSYADLANKPTLAIVASSGSYNDLAGKPALGSLAGLSSLSGLDASAATSRATGTTVARTHASRAADRVNVLDFGADPTGAADSYTAFNAAMATTTGALRVFVPRGTYKLSANVNDFAGRVSFDLDDGVSFTGGILYVGRTEQRAGRLRTTIVQGGVDPATQAIGEFQAVTNNGNQAGNGWYWTYHNYNVVSTNINGGDVAFNSVAQWHQNANTAGFAHWHIAISPYADTASAAVGNNWSVKSAEYNIVNNGPDWGWTDNPGSQPTMATGLDVETDSWGPTGGFGGHSLWSWGVTSGRNPNNRWTSYPAVFSVRSPGAVLTTDQISVNGTVVTLSGGAGTGSVADIVASVTAAAPANAAAATDGFSRLVLYSTNGSALTLANAHGTPLGTLGIGATTYTATKGTATIVRGAYNPPAVQTTDVLKITTPNTAVGGVTVALGSGARRAADVVAAINAAAIPSVNAWVGALGEVAIAETSANPLTLANATGTPLTTLGLPAGTTQPVVAPTSASGAYVPGTYNGFFVMQDAIAPGGRAFYAGGASVTTAAKLPYAPLEARYNWAHGLRLDQAALADNTALAMAASHAISWGTGTATAQIAATPTIAALRAIPASGLVDGASMLLLAYATRGDGGGGTFTWNAASTAADNSGTVVNPTGNAGAGRWLRQLADGRLTPQMFGAKGDGVTDDTAAFNAALAAGPVVVPNAKYVVGNVIVPNGAWMEGGAGLGYSGDIGTGTPTANQKAAVVSPVLLAKTGTTNCILNVNNCNDATLKGLFLDGVTMSCDGVSSGSTQLMMERVTVVRCVNGLGATSTAGYTGLTDLYTHVATLINCQFSNCTNGIANLIDSAMLGGACSANTTGVNLGSGANANTFAGCRFEWCYQDGVAGYNCASNVFIGGLFDRNAWRAVNLGTGCNDFTFTGVQFARNGSNNTYPNNAHIALNGTTSVFFNGCVSRTGKNDDGTGTLSPAYFIDYINTNALVTISGCDVSGYTTGFSFGTAPTSYVQRDNFGAGDTYANAARPYISGGAVRQTLFTKAAANVAPGQTTTIAMGQSPITTNYSATARELVITAVNFNSPYQTLSASFRLVFYRDTAVHLPSASAVFAEAGGVGLITFGTTSSLQLSTSGIAADGSSFTLGIKNGASSDGSNWGVWAELQ